LRIIETFEAGTQPSYRPATTAIAIRIDHAHATYTLTVKQLTCCSDYAL
jgi:hypothetical protein